MVISTTLPPAIVLRSEREAKFDFRYSSKCPPMDENGHFAYLVKQTTVSTGHVSHYVYRLGPGTVPGHTWESASSREVFKYEVLERLTITEELLVKGKKYVTDSNLGGAFNVEYVGPTREGLHVFRNLHVGWQSSHYYYSAEDLPTNIFPYV